MMKLILLILFLLKIESAYTQEYFNRIYRFDSIKGNATLFRSLRVLNNSIYLAGTSVVSLTNSVTNSGSFTRLDMRGNAISNTYYLDRNSGQNFDFQDDVILVENNKFTLAAYNFEGSFGLLSLNTNGVILKQKVYNTNDSTLYFVPNKIVKLANGYAIAQSLDTRVNAKALVFFTDSLFNYVKRIEIQEGERVNASNNLSKNKNNNLTLCIFKTDNRDTDTNYVYVSQLREIDTIGNTLWIYNTSKERYIYIKKFIQLANGNYLVWGDEELSRNGRLYRTVYDVFPYFAEINPQRGVVWEKRFNLGSTSRMYGFKMLRDSSMILTGGFSDGPNYGSGFFIKLNSRRDSIFRRNFRTTTITSSSVSHFPNQIEELDNGDLLIGGYVWDYRNISQSTTSGQWGWLVRTDSLGCSLEQSSCRVATQDIEKGPLSIKGFPNPTTGIFTVDLSEIPPNQKTVFKMYNTVGQLVMSQKLDSTADKIEFDARNLIEGFYIFTLNTEGGQIVANGKLQVQR